MPRDLRLHQLRTLVERLERLPASARREWMLREARERMVDVETGEEPRAIRAQEEAEPPAPPQASGARKARARKRPSPGHGRPTEQPVVSTEPARRPEPDPAPVAGSSSSPAIIGADDLLWLEDPSRDTLSEPGDGSTEPARWRRGLRG